MRKLVLAAAPLALFLFGCGEGTTEEPAPDADIQTPTFPVTEAGVRELATALRFQRELLDGLRPTAEDCAAIAVSEADAQALLTYVDELYGGLPPGGIGGSPAQTEIDIRMGTVADLKAGNNESLPGGYTNVAARLRDGLTIWGFAYVEPGEDSGMAFDGLVFVNDRWVFAPKLWRAFR